MSTYPHWKQKEIEKIRDTSTIEEILELSLGALRRIPSPVGMVCGPVSTGGLGSIEKNIQSLDEAITNFELHKIHVFDQSVLESGIRRLRRAFSEKERLSEKQVNLRILTELYLPILESGLVQTLYFLPDWETSFGARWEHEHAKRLRLNIVYLTEYNQDDFESVEKTYVRKNLWDKVLDDIATEKKTINVFEFLSEREFWDYASAQYPNHSISVDGVTLASKLSLKSSSYDRLFRERYDTLIENPEFLHRFPYDLINLDYCGGGRFYNNDPFRYHKLPEIRKTIAENAKHTDSFYFLLTLDTADLVYPCRKDEPDILRNTDISDELVSFLDEIEHLDTRPYWLFVAGNTLEVIRACERENCSIELAGPIITYIAESKGHKTRMVAWAYRISSSLFDNRTYQVIFEQIKNTTWLRCEGNQCRNMAANYN